MFLNIAKMLSDLSYKGYLNVFWDSFEKKAENDQEPKKNQLLVFPEVRYYLATSGT